ncbi:MATE family efflux transporter [Timonella sp. A28]|uniref:MATE family efflux transporter n=1 Tax=Timonella sp. A28 TaxID=3442640 RepID=UPI003EC046B4
MNKTLTAGTPWRVILVFTIPLLIGNVVQQLYQVVDAMVVGQELGVNALAAVGATGSMLFLLIGFAWGMTSGFAIPTAQAYGAQDHAAVRRSVATGTVLTGLVSVLITVGAPLITRPLLEVMQTPPELLDDATTFAVISFLGAAATMFFNFLAAIIRAIGDSRTPLVFLIISCVFNIALVMLFVMVLGYGVGGAAFATVIAQLFSVVLCLMYVRKSLPILHLKRADWKLERASMLEHLRIGLPMGFMASIIAIGTLTVQVRLNSLGADAVAAYTTATRVDGVAVAFLGSLGVAVSTYVAQNWGAGKIDRIKVGVRHAIIMSVIGSLILAFVLIAVGEIIVRSFVGDSASVQGVVDMAHDFLVVNGLLYFALGILFVTRNAIQGLGRPLIPTLSSVTELVMRVAAAIVLGGLFGFAGIIWSNPLAWLGAAVLLLPAWLKARRSLDDDYARHIAETGGVSAAVEQETQQVEVPALMGVSETERDIATTIVGEAETGVRGDVDELSLHGSSTHEREKSVSSC